MSKPSAPAPPDYVGAARQQGQANIQASIANSLLSRPDQVTPWGGLKWNQTGETQVPGIAGEPAITLPQYTATTSLNPELQGLINQVGTTVSKPLDFSSLGPNYNQAVADALYNRSARYLDPQWAQLEDAERTRLANQGFSANTEGYNNALGNFQRSKDQAYASARDAATAAGSQIGLQQRQQQIAEILTQRQEPLSEVNSLLRGTQLTVPTQPTAAAPIAGAAAQQGQYAGDVFNSQVGTYNAALGGGAAIGSAALAAVIV